MNRSDALDWLAYDLGPIYTALGRVTTDGASGFGPAITAAAVAAGVDPETFDVAIADQPKLTAFMRYFALRPLLAASAAQFDFSVDAPLTSIKDRGTFKNVKVMYDQAYQEALFYGLQPENTTAGFLRLNTDWSEVWPYEDVE